MKNLPQPIIFNPVDSCEDIGHCQILDVDDRPSYRLSRLCDIELLGTTEKLPCEDYQVIENMAELFAALVGMEADDAMVRGTGSGTHTATAAGYLQAGTTYVISYQMRGLSSGAGSFKIGAGDNEGEVRDSNGFFVDTIATGAGTDLVLHGMDNGESTFDGTFSNIVIQCIRYSSLFAFEWTGGGDSPITFVGQTKFCITPGTIVTWRREVAATPGKTYKLSFRITGNTSTSLIGWALWRTVAGGTATATNGYFEEYIEAGEGEINHDLELSVEDTFNGCIEDITLYEVSDIRTGLFNPDGTENECADLEQDNRDDSTIITIDTNGNPCGCVKVGYADSCEDYHGQFSGSNLLVVPSSTDVDLETGEFEMEGDPAEGSVYAQYDGVIDPGRCYSGVIKVCLMGAEANVASFQVTAIIGGTSYDLGQVDNPNPGGDCNEFVIDELVSGSLNAHVRFVVTYVVDGENTGRIDFTTIDLHLCEGQFIPRYWSNCFNIVEKGACDDTLLIRYTNPKPLFGLVYETALPFLSFRMRAKLWHDTYPKTREVNRDSLGHKTVNYSDIQKFFKLTTEPLPAYLIEALTVALDHSTLQIGRGCANMIITPCDNMVEYVSEADEISPNWNKSTPLAPVEVTLSQQDKRMVKSYC